MSNIFCPLTGIRLNDQEAKIHKNSALTFTYEFLPIGKAIIAMPTYMTFLNQRQFNHPDLAGICRNAFEDGIEPPMIDTGFLVNGIKNISIPKNIREKGNHLLKYMYKRGGRDFAEFNFQSVKDYPLVYADDAAEFNKIIENLNKRLLIRIGDTLGMAEHLVHYRDVTLSELGIAEIEKELPKIPMISLVNQEIETGDFEVDKIINYAKKLFFEEPQTMEKMRSACENLIYVLEPLRKQCEIFFGKNDTGDFFKIVNEFDIRHNKHTTKQIQYPEQLEWIFYSLLNTINTFIKLKTRMA